MKRLTTIRLASELLERLDEQAEKQNRTRTNMVETAIIHYLAYHTYLAENDGHTYKTN